MNDEYLILDDSTCREIDKAIEQILKEVGLRSPPINIEEILEHLEVHRDFYDLTDPSLLRKFWHKVQVKKQKLFNIINNINLAAVWLPDQERILVDTSLPLPKKEWASFHDATHRILIWHREFFLGDTAQTLDPDFQMRLEAEANYGASALMFGGKVFTKEALDTSPGWKSIDILRKRYDKSYLTTLRRYVQFSHHIPMALMVSTPWWMNKPEDQEFRYRHFIPSKKFIFEFDIDSLLLSILNDVDQNTDKRRGGPVGDFSFSLMDKNRELHEFFAESFFNQRYILTLIYHYKKLNNRKFIIQS